jgi:urease accessory protein
MQPLANRVRDDFNANRAVGHVAFSVEASRGVTRRRTTDEGGPMRVRFPNAHSRHLEAILVNTAGGIAGGDALTVEIDVGRGARLTTATAAAEKIYRTHGPEAALSLKLNVQAAGTLHWLPQETILFDQARLARTVDITLADDANLLFVETQVFGRSAMGETIGDGSFTDRWRVRRGGKLVFAENVRLGGDIAAKLARPAIGAGAIAFATVIVAPCDEAKIETWRTAQDGLRGHAAISLWNGIAVARFCAGDAASLRHDMLQHLSALQVELPRLWYQ